MNSRWNCLVWSCALAAIATLSAAGLRAADLVKSPAASSTAEPAGVEMFAAMKAGDIEVQLIPRSDRQARILIKNKTEKPLNVRLPDAFAGVPVLAQALAAGGGGRDRDRDNDNNQNQFQGLGGGLGGGFGGGGFGGGGGGFGGGGGGFGGGGGGLFNVPAEKTAQFKVQTVCLEHGKRDPKPNIPYEIRPIESFTQKPEVRQLLRLLSAGKIDQRAAQAAAWHLENGMSWQELAAKRIKHLGGSSEPYFMPDQIARGLQAAEFSIASARTIEPTTSSATVSAATP